MNVRITGKRPTASWCVAVACFTLPPLAHAALDPFTVTAGETVTHDSNVFRSADDIAVPDTQSDTRARLDYTEAFGRSQATAWAAVDASRYKHSTQLDNDGYLLGGEFDWATIGHLSGKLGGEDNSSLYRPGLSGDEAYQGKSILHTKRAFTRATLGGSGPFGVEGGLEISSSKNSAAALNVNDLNQWDGDLGVYYMQSPSLKLSLLGRRTNGKYPYLGSTTEGTSPNLVTVPSPIDFHRDDIILGGLWTPGGFTSVEAQVARTQEDYSVSSGRHYWTGFLKGSWQVTGHIKLMASVARDSAQDFEGGVLGQGSISDQQGGSTGSTGSTGTPGSQPAVAQQSLSMNDAVLLSGLWQMTSKIDLSGTFLHASRRYNDVQLGTLLLNGSDDSNQYQLGLNYQINRAIKAGCAGSRSTHVPGALGVLGGAYVSNAYSCYAELSLH